MSGTSAYSLRGPTRLVLLVLAVVIGGAGSWGAFTRISGAVVAPGEVATEWHAVEHAEGGVVVEVFVRNGTLVAEGEALLRIDDAQLRSELAGVEARLFGLLAERGRLEAERDRASGIRFDHRLGEAADLKQRQRELFSARRDRQATEAGRLSSRSEQITGQLHRIESQRAAILRQRELLEEVLSNQRSLQARGLAQTARVTALEIETTQLTGRLAELSAVRLEAEGRLTDIEGQRAALRHRPREEALARLRELRAPEAELEARRRELLRRMAAAMLRAPVAGHVQAPELPTPGTVLGPGERAMVVVPETPPAGVTARIRPEDIDQVAPGQRATVRLLSLDGALSPELAGTLVTLSAAPVTTQDMPPHYRAEVALDEGWTDRLPAGIALRPGMPAEVVFPTRPRAPLAYLLQPLTDHAARTFRAP
ncbi:HlyD family type I secretion periplasmic adaptor subunit [Histidinibacterium aquaticum]|nr:HlyD family type I secretion periplasmic adaptor subunit [Histidinibacterium aquaticum]